MAVVESGREAWTGYEVRERLRGATWVAAQLHTGRTHQIRVHFQHLGFPLAGDVTYGRKQNVRLEEQLGAKVPRQMLHAHTLAFAHPRSDKPMTFAAPLPEDFEEILQALRAPE
jgi:23S rRNA pseudouridine1911/1915/1917 synthase